MSSKRDGSIHILLPTRLLLHTLPNVSQSPTTNISGLGKSSCWKIAIWRSIMADRCGGRVLKISMSAEDDVKRSV